MENLLKEFEKKNNMATKNEKVFGSVVGASVGGYVANRWARNNKNIKKENVPIYTIRGILLGGILGYGVAEIIGTPNDTINYTHFYRGKRVYEGITYTDRFDKRMKEHKMNGKSFTSVIKSRPRPRVEAIRVEKDRILKFRPTNNIQHNRKVVI